MTNQDYVFSIIEQCGIALAPLQKSLENSENFSELLEIHGWQVASDTFNISDLQNLFSVSSDLVKLQTLLEQITLIDNTAKLNAYLEILSIFRNVIIKVRDLSKLSQNPPTNLPFPFNKAEFWSQFPNELVEGLIVSYIESYKPAIFAVLFLLGIIDEIFIDVGSTIGRVNYTKRVLQWDRLFKALSNPHELIKEVYGWGSDQLKFDIFLSRLRYFFLALGLIGDLHKPRQQLLDQYYDQSNPFRDHIKELHVPIAGGFDDISTFFELAFSILPITPDDGSGSPNSSGPPVGIAIWPSIVGVLPQLMSGIVDLKLSGGFNSDEGIRLEIRPKKSIAHLDDHATNNIDAEASLVYRPIHPIIFVGTESSSRLQSTDFTAGLHIIGPFDDPEVKFEIGSEKFEFVIDASDADSFVKKIFGDKPQIVKFSGTIIWSSKTGLHFKGNAGLQLLVRIDKTLNIVKIDSLALGINTSDSNIDLSIGLTGSIQLPYLNMSVDNIGIKLRLIKAQAEKPGLLGDLDLEFGFKPPDGFGITLDTNGVRGGGFILRTEDRYAGVLDIDLRGFQVQALAVLDTKPSVSFVLLIFTNFPNPIQLGAGWKITRIGGLIGFDRTINENEIAAGITKGILNSILFPDNVVQNAPRIIEDLIRVFPTLSGQYFIGPAIRIEYGTPTLLKGDVAVILEFPNPFELTILGKVSAKIPEKNTIIQINIGLLGSIDFTNGRASFYGRLYDSKILAFTLAGDMAMAASWGSEKNFIFSIGGIHPRFTPPSNFPPFNAEPLRRLEVALSSSVSFKCYLALSSNTFQVGARVDARFSGSGATITGWLGFDALIQFSPLYYQVDIYAGFSVKYRRRTLASITFSGSLEGPNPHRIKGRAKFSILIWDVTVRIDEKFGPEQPPELEKVEPWDYLEPALSNKQNWSAEFPEWADIGVTIKELPKNESKDEVIVHPLGTLKLSQKVAPLNYTLTKFGTADLADMAFDKFQIKSSSLISDDPKLPAVQDYFAPAQFSRYTNAEKISLKSFDLMDSGVSFGIDSKKIDCDFRPTTITTREMVYETQLDNPKSTIREDKDEKERKNKQIPPFSPSPSQIQIFEISGSSYQNKLRNNKNMQYRLQYQNDFVSIFDNNFFITDNKFNNFDEVAKRILELLSFPPDDPLYEDLKNEYGNYYSQANALEKLRTLKNKYPTFPYDELNLQVISAYEKEVTNP